MKRDMIRNRDFWAGLMLIGIGVAAVWIAHAQDYGFGSTRRMGPGFFPTILGWVLSFFGLYILIMGIRRNEAIKEKLSIRALVVVPASVVMFGVLMKYVGFIPALVALIFGVSLASREFRFTEVLLLTVALTILSVTVFVLALGLPFPLIRGM